MQDSRLIILTIIIALHQCKIADQRVQVMRNNIILVIIYA